jgi:hypothetical protein
MKAFMISLVVVGILTAAGVIIAAAVETRGMDKNKGT